MVAIAPRIPNPNPAQLLLNAEKGTMKQALLDKLNALDPETLAQIQKSFFEGALATPKMPAPGSLPTFGVQPPAEAFAQNFENVEETYHRPSEESANKENQGNRKALPRHALNSKGPGIFSNPAADKAAAAIRQQQTQTLNFLSNQLGQAYAKGDMSEFVGPGKCFEDALAEMLFKIADKEQRDLMDQLRQYERGDQGLNGYLAKGAKGVAGAAAGAAGGALGGILGGPAGAAIGASVGLELGQRFVGDVTGNYGESSKQVQFQKIQMSVQNMTQMIQMLSNILHAFDSANRNTISNLRG